MAEFITRTELAEKIGITTSGLEKAKAGNTALWKAITAQMDIKNTRSWKKRILQI